MSTNVVIVYIIAGYYTIICALFEVVRAPDLSSLAQSAITMQKITLAINKAFVIIALHILELSPCGESVIY
jgi:hypothetical protein